MVMWNLVGHGLKWAARGVDAFSRTEAGKKTGEVASRSFHAAKEASRDMIETYKQSKTNQGQFVGTARAAGKVDAGTSVVTHDGRFGTAVRYLQRNEIGGTLGDTSLTELLLVDLAQHTDELDRYLIIHENSVRAV